MTPKTKRETNYIFNMRRNRRLLQKQLAVLIGHRYTYMLSKYEHGVSLPPLETGLLLEIVLGVRLPELYPDLYARLHRDVMKRCATLPSDVRQVLLRRLSGKDDDEHT